MNFSITTFVGRHSEMAELTVALDEAILGQGRLVMLMGEPGIGKTRTAQELASIAEQRGAHVLWGRCHEEQGAPLYWPWTQVIRTFIHNADDDTLRSQMGLGAADMAEVVPQIKERFPNLESPPAQEPEQARFRLFDSITTFLKNASQGQPMVLILDNLHWADRSSLLLLEFLAQEILDANLMVVCTYRDVELSRQHLLVQTLGELTKLPFFKRIPLNGLIEEETGHFIELISGISAPPELLRALHTQTQGNPLFLAEVVQLLAQEGALTPERLAERQSSTDFRVPEGVRDAIARNFNHLSGLCNQVLTTASVIGREFDFRLLGPLNSDLTEDQLLEVLDEALGAHVIEEMPGGGERYQFRHVLIQQTLSEELSTSRKVRLHARIGEALEDLYSADVEDHAAELAHHFAEAKPVIGPERSVRYSLLAGEQALAGYAWEEALEHYERAHVSRQDKPMDVEVASIVSGLGHALTSLGQYQQGTTLLKRSFAYYVDIGDVERAVAILEYPHALTPLQLMVDILSQAIDLVPAESLQSARLLCSYGLAVGRKGNGYAQGQEAFEKSLAIARREGDLALEMSITAASANVEAQHAKWDQSLEKSLRALELATHFDAPIDKMRAHQWACNSLFINGDPVGAVEHANDLHAIAESLRNDYWIQMGLSLRYALDHLSGNWGALHALDDRFTIVWSVAVAMCSSALAMARYQTGDFDEGRDYMDSLTRERGKEYLNVWSLWSFVAGSFCYITGESSLLSEVEVAATDAISSPVLQPYWAREAHAALALVAVIRNDALLAANQYSALRAHANTVLKTGGISIGRLLGLLANVLGNFEGAQLHFEDTLMFCRKAGYRPELAWTCHDYASILYAEGRQEQASLILEEAISISTELGMRPLLEKAIALKDKAKSLKTTSPNHLVHLSKREVEVLELIAEGKSNREIADDLVLSIRTVQRHVANIYSKNNVHNRVQAAALVLNNPDDDS